MNTAGKKLKRRRRENTALRSPHSELRISVLSVMFIVMGLWIAICLIGVTWLDGLYETFFFSRFLHYSSPIFILAFLWVWWTGCFHSNVWHHVLVVKGVPKRSCRVIFAVWIFISFCLASSFHVTSIMSVILPVGKQYIFTLMPPLMLKPKEKEEAAWEDDDGATILPYATIFQNQA